MDIEVVIGSRFCGPTESGNGGYSAGLLAQHLTGTVEVTLRRPPPLETVMTIALDDGEARLLCGDDLIASAVPSRIDEVPRASVDLDVARAASTRSPFIDAQHHPFPYCFTCGPLREDGDGLRIFAGPVLGSDVFAATWTPVADDEPTIWAALDCPSAAPLYAAQPSAPSVLGRITARIIERPTIVGEHVVVAWARGSERRKHFTSSAIYGPNGTLIAQSQATWITLAS